MATSKWGDLRILKTVSETVHSTLHRNIVNLNLIPGTLMSEKDISEKMNVSRTPVREAFIRLSEEALVTVIPQKGTFVSRINLDRLKEERFLRESLELSVLELIIAKKKELPLDDLILNLDKQKTALDDKDNSAFVELDDIFHSMLFNIADKNLCFRVLMSVNSHYRRVRYLSMSVDGVSEENLKHHQLIIEAIRNQNLSVAKKIMKNHLRKINIEKESIFTKYKEYFEPADSINRGFDFFDEKKRF